MLLPVALLVGLASLIEASLGECYFLVGNPFPKKARRPRLRSASFAHNEWTRPVSGRVFGVAWTPGANGSLA